MNSTQDNQQTNALLPGTAALIEELRQNLESQQSLRTKDLITKAEHHLGFSLGAGRYDFRYLFDALEVALHKLIESRCETLRVLEPAHILGYLTGLLELLPTQRIRTIEQTLFQQFCSPATLAFTANYL